MTGWLCLQTAITHHALVSYCTGNRCDNVCDCSIFKTMQSPSAFCQHQSQENANRLSSSTLSETHNTQHSQISPSSNLCPKAMHATSYNVQLQLTSHSYSQNYPAFCSCTEAAETGFFHNQFIEINSNKCIN